jgi:hypothetical protein
VFGDKLQLSLLWQYATNRKVEVSIRYDLNENASLPNVSSRTMIIGSIQPLIEISAWDLLGVKGGRSARNCNNLTIICEPTV